MLEPFINIVAIRERFRVKEAGALYEPGHGAPSLSRALRYCSRFVYLIGPESYIRAREPDIRYDICR